MGTDDGTHNRYKQEALDAAKAITFFAVPPCARDEADVLNALWDWRAGMHGHPYYAALGADFRAFVRGYK